MSTGPFLRSHEESQVHVPDSFVALHQPHPGSRLRIDRQQVADRHEFCDDLAHALVDAAQLQAARRDDAQAEVLRSILEGLQAPDAGLSGDEALWVTRRLAELLGWGLPAELAWADQGG